MSAQSLQAITVVFAAKDLANSHNGFQLYSNNSLTRVVNASIAYNLSPSFDLRTLSTNHASAGHDVAGLLYVPDLPPDDPCTNLSSKYVPTNVTRLADLPTSNYPLVALAPWINANCTLSYLNAAQSAAPVQGFLFWLAGDDTNLTPPEPVSEVWDLQDGGSWKKEHHWPVYAIPGQSGQMLIQASDQYSGQMSQVPSGQELARYYDSSDYVRIYVDVQTAGAGTTLPSIWLFLLVVLGILFAVMGGTSLLMHYLQRRRRQQLRQRVLSGEIDLETLGIKRLTVPQEVLDEMPLYIYGTGAPVAAAKSKPKDQPLPASPPTDKLTSSANSSRPSSPTATARPTPALNRSTSYRPTPLQQPTCAICLDDFIPPPPSPEQAEQTPPSTIRELPCHHIFHPECVDTFLLNNSSLCPMCKKSALPAGFCPRNITNAMVRRERIVRRLQERRAAAVLSGDGLTDDVFFGDAAGTRLPGSQSRRAFSGVGLAWLGGAGGGRRITSSPLPTTNSQPMTELPPATPLRRSNTGGVVESSSQVALPPPPPATSSRREWARQRAVAMLGRGAAAPPPVVDDDPDEVEAEAPRWRKTLRSVFPGLGGGGGGASAAEGPSSSSSAAPGR